MSEPVRLDEVDAEILKQLLIEGRKEFVEIAANSDVSEDVIWQHYTNLKKKGVIVGSTIQIDYRKLGYDGAASFFVDVPVPEQKDTARQMRKIPGIYDVYQWGTHSTLWAISDFMKLTEVDHVKQLIKRIPSVLRLQVEILAEIRNMPENLSILDELRCLPKHKEAKNEQPAKSEGIDKIDLHLIKTLESNSRQSFNKIAKQLGISNGTVTRRFASLKSRGVIRPLIQVNPERIGYFSEATFGLIISAETNIATVSNALGRIPDVTAVLRTIGINDLSVVVQVKSLKHIFSLEAEIARIPGMKEISPPTLNQFPVLPYPGEHLSTF